MDHSDMDICFLPFHTVHGVLKARILKWFAIPFSSIQVKKQQLEPDMEQQTGSKLEKDYVKDYDFFLNLRISLASIQIT